MADNSIAKHTPGPWKVVGVGMKWIIPAIHDDRKIGGSTNRADHVNDFAHVIATVCTDAAWFKREQIDANADLLSAAPDLLNAAQIGLNYIEALCINTPNPKKRKNYADAASILRAAIAKAGGVA